MKKKTEFIGKAGLTKLMQVPASSTIVFLRSGIVIIIHHEHGQLVIIVTVIITIAMITILIMVTQL